MRIRAEIDPLERGLGKRSALLALLLPLRRGDGDWQQYVRYAEGMLDEREFFVRKAIGWVLRETGKENPGAAEDLVTRGMLKISCVTLREAVKYLDPSVRSDILVAYRARARHG